MSHRNVSAWRWGMAAASVWLINCGGRQAVAADTKAESKKSDAAVLKYGDGKPDGKKSLGGTGEMIRFELPEGVTAVRGIKIHGSRYGYPQAPKENFEISFL